MRRRLIRTDQRSVGFSLQEPGEHGERSDWFICWNHVTGTLREHRGLKVSNRVRGFISPTVSKSLTGDETVLWNEHSEDERVYLHGEEGDVVKLFDEATDLLTVLVDVEPGPPQDLHLRHTARSTHCPPAVS